MLHLFCLKLTKCLLNYSNILCFLGQLIKFSHIFILNSDILPVYLSTLQCFPSTINYLRAILQRLIHNIVMPNYSHLFQKKLAQVALKFKMIHPYQLLKINIHKLLHILGLTVTTFLIYRDIFSVLSSLNDFILGVQQELQHTLILLFCLDAGISVLKQFFRIFMVFF